MIGLSASSIIAALHETGSAVVDDEYSTLGGTKTDGSGVGEDGTGVGRFDGDFVGELGVGITTPAGEQSR